MPLRGIAALLVVFYHVGVTTGVLLQFPMASGILELGKHGVELFFLISGLVIPLSLISKDYRIRSIHRFFAKRSLRIEPTYLVAVVLAIAFILVRERIFQDNALASPTFHQVLSNIFYLVPFNDAAWLSPVFWTLGIELQFYLLCAFLFGIGIRWGNAPSLTALVFASALVPKFLNSGAFIIAWIDCFAMGLILALAALQNISRKKALWLLALMATIMLFNRSIFVVCLLSLASVLILLRPKSDFGRLWNFLGVQSYSLYLTHCLTGTTVANLMLRYAHEFTHSNPIVAILFGTLVSVSLAQVLYWAVEKPTESLSKRISMR